MNKARVKDGGNQYLINISLPSHVALATSVCGRLEVTRHAITIRGNRHGAAAKLGTMGPRPMCGYRDTVCPCFAERNGATPSAAAAGKSKGKGVETTSGKRQRHCIGRNVVGCSLQQQGRRSEEGGRGAVTERAHRDAAEVPLRPIREPRLCMCAWRIPTHRRQPIHRGAAVRPVQGPSAVYAWRIRITASQFTAALLCGRSRVPVPCMHIRIIPTWAGLCCTDASTLGMRCRIASHLTTDRARVS
jgi:hypothetical protein